MCVLHNVQSTDLFKVPVSVLLQRPHPFQTTMTESDTTRLDMHLRGFPPHGLTSLRFHLGIYTPRVWHFQVVFRSPHRRIWNLLNGRLEPAMSSADFGRREGDGAAVMIFGRAQGSGKAVVLSWVVLASRHPTRDGSVSGSRRSPVCRLFSVDPALHPRARSGDEFEHLETRVRVVAEWGKFGVYFCEV